MKRFTTWTATAVLLGAWASMAGATSIWTEELYTWIIRFFVMQAGGYWG